MTISTAILAVALAVSPPAHVVESWTFDVGPASARAKAQLLADGFTVALVTTAPFEGGRPRPDRPVVRAAAFAQGTRAFIVSEHPLHRVSVDTRHGRARVTVEYERRADAVRRRLLAPLPAAIPIAYREPKLTRAEKALQSGHTTAALELYQALADDYALQSWARLRVADLSLLEGDEQAACAGYRRATTEFGRRTAGVVGRVRMHALGCRERLQVPLSIAQLVRRVRRMDGPVGHFLWQETLFLLGLVADTEEIADLLALPDHHRRGNRLPARLRARLLARAMRLAPTPYQVTELYLRHEAEVSRHPERLDLTLRAAQAMIELDLPSHATGLLIDITEARALSGTGALWQKRRGDLEAAALLVEAHQVAGKTFLSRRTAHRFGLRVEEPPPVVESDGIVDPALLATIAKVDARTQALRSRIESATGGDSQERRP